MKLLWDKNHTQPEFVRCDKYRSILLSHYRHQDCDMIITQKIPQKIDLYRPQLINGYEVTFLDPKLQHRNRRRFTAF